MALHSISFGLYMLAASIQQLFFALAFSDPKNPKKKYDLIISDIACNGASFIA